MSVCMSILEIGPFRAVCLSRHSLESMSVCSCFDHLLSKRREWDRERLTCWYLSGGQCNIWSIFRVTSTLITLTVWTHRVFILRCYGETPSFKSGHLSLHLSINRKGYMTDRHWMATWWQTYVICVKKWRPRSWYRCKIKVKEKWEGNDTRLSGVMVGCHCLSDWKSLMITHLVQSISTR